MKKTSWWWIISFLIGVITAVAGYPIIDNNGLNMRNLTFYFVKNDDSNSA
jgi:hypothetical protein